MKALKRPSRFHAGAAVWGGDPVRSRVDGWVDVCTDSGRRNPDTDADLDVSGDIRTIAESEPVTRAARALVVGPG